jgi:hypothetical protein
MEPGNLRRKNEEIHNNWDAENHDNLSQVIGVPAEA